MPAHQWVTPLGSRSLQTPKQSTYKANRRVLPNLRTPVPTRVPPFQAAVVVTKTLRFQSNAVLTAANATITGRNLLDLLVLADTATSAQRLFSSLKIHHVKVWGPQASTLVPVTVSVEFHTDTATGIGAPNKIQSDTSIGSSECAFVHTSPDPKAVSGMWQSSAATIALFTLTGPINSIVDVTLSLCLQNGEAVVAVQNALVGATVGTVYCRGLDGLAAATTVLPPLSYATA